MPDKTKIVIETPEQVTVDPTLEKPIQLTNVWYRLLWVKCASEYKPGMTEFELRDYIDNVLLDASDLPATVCSDLAEEVAAEYIREREAAEKASEDWRND